MTRFQKSSKDGKTAWERRRGRPYKRRLPKFGEPVMFLRVPPTKRRNKYEDRFVTGVYCGLIDRSNMVIVATPHGCEKVNSIRRLPRSQWRDPDLVMPIKGTPWQYAPSVSEAAADARAGDDVPVGVTLRPVVEEAYLPPANQRKLREPILAYRGR